MRMRQLMLATLATVAIAGISPAAAFDYPYCLQGFDLGAPGDCSYPSYEACQAAASGRNVFCNINPRVAFRRPPPQRLPRGQRAYPPYPDYND